MEEPNPEPDGDKYAKAKIEEPNLRLPKALLKPDGDPNDDLCYMRIFEEDGRRSQHLAEAVAAGAQATRKVYRIRNKEPWESAEAEKKLREEFGDPEIIDGQLRTRDGRQSAATSSSSVEIRGSKREVEEAGCSSSSSSTGTQKEKQQDVDETGKGN
ncbi:hypothetical protein L6452_28020 [Arctium lappa]|uniref:Uncharacterized protein n=1 Tax=Arctium lappa TaxID=4217 RepID=A0ACB8ZWQ9_ARCLA|nr:hypothetical protein L6452_28020 [Arctium lappa]